MTSVVVSYFTTVQTTTRYDIEWKEVVQLSVLFSLVYSVKRYNFFNIWFITSKFPF